MNLSELNNFLEVNKEYVLWKRLEEDIGAIYVKSIPWDTVIRIDLECLQNINEQEILMQLCAGKDIEHITRVTGYLSKIAGWNPGKLGELKDRHRVGAMEI